MQSFLYCCQIFSKPKWSYVIYGCKYPFIKHTERLNNQKFVPVVSLVAVNIDGHSDLNCPYWEKESSETGILLFTQLSSSPGY